MLCVWPLPLQLHPSPSSSRCFTEHPNCFSIPLCSNCCSELHSKNLENLLLLDLLRRYCHHTHFLLMSIRLAIKKSLDERGYPLRFQDIPGIVELLWRKDTAHLKRLLRSVKSSFSFPRNLVVIVGGCCEFIPFSIC